MKNIQKLVILFIVVGMLMIAGSVHASFSGSWVETSDEAHAVSWDFSGTDDKFGIIGVDENLILLDSSSFSSSFDIYSSTSGGFEAKNLYTQETISLGSEYFNFYFNIDGTEYTTYDVVVNVPEAEYILSKDLVNKDLVQVVVNDVSPVPLPKTAFLLAFGVLGGVMVLRQGRSNLGNDNELSAV